MVEYSNRFGLRQHRVFISTIAKWGLDNIMCQIVVLHYRQDYTLVTFWYIPYHFVKSAFIFEERGIVMSNLQKTASDGNILLNINHIWYYSGLCIPFIRIIFCISQL